MKKLLLTLLVAMTASGAIAQQVPFPDVPAGHWAADAVADIADLGIVIGFPDGTFRGNESFTRYQAALVISRMLDVVRGEISSATAVLADDITALQNALQELAGDVDARISALEGDVASLSADVADNTARIAELEEALQLALEMELPEGVLADLQNQIDALGVAVDSAQATADAAHALAREALDGLDALEQQVMQNTRSIDALNDLVALLNEEVLDLERRIDGLVVGADPELVARLDRAERDIANIREFVILLRRNQVAMDGRITALEERLDATDARIDGIDERLVAVEEQLITLDGTIDLEYFVGRLGGDQLEFDIDRAYGVDLPRSMDTTFGDGDDEEEDISQQAGGVSVDLNLTLGFVVDRDGESDPRGLNSFSAVIDLTLAPGTILDPDDPDDDGERFEGYVFTVENVKTTFDPIGGPPLTFQFGEAIEAQFTGYVFQTLEDTGGFVASVGAPDFLEFLDPSLTIAYGSPPDTDAFDNTDTYFRAIRGTLSPLDGFTGGVSFAQRARNADSHGDTDENNITTTVFGVDGQINISIFDLNFEYASSSTYDTAADATFNDTALLYAQLEVDGENLPILTSARANYRDIPGFWDGINRAEDEDDVFMETMDDYEFDLDQAGFGVAAELNVFILDIEAYVDIYETGAPDVSNTAFGVGVGANIFRGFSAAGFFKSASIDGDAVDRTTNRGEDLDFRNLDFSVADNYSLSGRSGRSGNQYVTGFGVGLFHDGAAEDALISNLNLSAQFQQLGADFDITIIDVQADYTLNVSILELTPYVGFTSFSESEPVDNTTTIRAGTGIETEPLDIFLQPSLSGVVNFRTTSHGNEAADDPFTSTEFQAAVGLSLNEFLFDNSVLTARYALYNTTNVNMGLTDAPGDSSDANRNDESVNINGYEVIWNYWDLEFAYGVYTFTDNFADIETAAQAFRIKYSVRF